MPSSVVADVSSAIAAGVTAEALTYGEDATAVTVSQRKTPSLPAGKDPPEVVVSVGEEGEIEYLTATEVMVTYPAAVTIITPTGTKQADDATVREMRQRLRRRMELDATWSAVSGFNAVKASGKIPYETGALAKDLNYSVLVFAVEVIESRT